jgi:hypothetical protein
MGDVNRACILIWIISYNFELFLTHFCYSISFGYCRCEIFDNHVIIDHALPNEIENHQWFIKGKLNST